HRAQRNVDVGSNEVKSAARQERQRFRQQAVALLPCHGHLRLDLAQLVRLPRAYDNIERFLADLDREPELLAMGSDGLPQRFREGRLMFACAQVRAVRDQAFAAIDEHAPRRAFLDAQTKSRVSDAGAEAEAQNTAEGRFVDASANGTEQGWRHVPARV